MSSWRVWVGRHERRRCVLIGYTNVPKPQLFCLKFFIFEDNMPTPARKRDQRPSGDEKVSPDPKMLRHQGDDHASNTENMNISHASAESSSPESNSDMKEIKEMLALSQSQMATVLSDNRKIQRDLETLRDSMNKQDRELKQTQQQLTKAVAQNDLLRRNWMLLFTNSGNSKRKSTTFKVSRTILNNILAKTPWNCTESHAGHILPPKRRCSR